MGEAACSCDDPELVAVIDRNMAFPYISGNAYSRYCTCCGRRYFCKKTFWEGSDEKYVIPQGDDEPIPIEEYDDENFFHCPKCEKPHFGFPDHCESCDAPFQWEEAAD